MRTINSQALEMAIANLLELQWHLLEVQCSSLEVQCSSLELQWNTSTTEEE